MVSGSADAGPPFFKERKMIEIVNGSMGGGKLSLEGCKQDPTCTGILLGTGGKLTINGNAIYNGKQRVWLGDEKDKELDILQKLYDANATVTLTQPKPKVKNVYGRKWKVVYSKDSKKFFDKNKLEYPEAAKETKDKE